MLRVLYILLDPLFLTHTRCEKSAQHVLRAPVLKAAVAQTQVKARVVSQASFSERSLSTTESYNTALERLIYIDA